MQIVFETELERDKFLQQCDARSCADCILFHECSKELFITEHYYRYRLFKRSAATLQAKLIQKGDEKAHDT